MALQFGQLIKFEIDNQEVKAIVLDFDQDDEGIWYGMCFLNQNKLFGRQIPSGLINTTCVDLLDLTYLHNKALKSYEVVEQYDIDTIQVGIGSLTPVKDHIELLRDYKAGLEQRNKVQTPCNEDISGLNPVRECYFELKKVLKVSATKD